MEETAAQLSLDVQHLRRSEYSLCKSRLHQFAKRVGLPLPYYHTTHTGPLNAPEFNCSVTVGDDTYVSPTTFTQKKAAEEEAAKCAWKDILEKRVEKGDSVAISHTDLRIPIHPMEETVAQLPQNVQHLRLSEHSLCKSRLHDFAIRVGLPLPYYHVTHTGPPNAPEYKCSVTVGDDAYVSPTTFTQKKAAEEEAAKCAWKGILEKRVEKGLSLIRMINTFYKATLNEFAAKLHVEKPKYQSLKTQELPAVFVSTLEFRGVSYTGGPSKTKKDAAQLVARDALISILGDSEVGLTLLELLISKAKLISSLQISKDPRRCATEPEEGYNSTGEGASSGQIVPGSDILIATSNEEQFKYAIASSSCSLQTQGAPVHPLIQNHPAPTIQTFANEGCQVTLASQADNLVSPMPSLLPNHRTTPSLTCSHEGCKSISTFPADGYVLLVPSLPQNPSIPPVQVSANEGCKLSSTSQAPQANNSILPEVPEKSTTPLQNVADHSGKVTSAPQPVVGLATYYPPETHIFSTSVPLIEDGSASLPSQSVGKRNHRKKKYKANKRARMANQMGNLLCSAPTQ